MTHDWKHYEDLSITVCRYCGRKKCKERLKEQCAAASKANPPCTSPQ